MAEARSVVTQLRVAVFKEGKDATKDFIRAWRKTFFRRFFRTRNLILNRMWPTSWWNLGITVAFFSILLVNDWPWAQPINSRLWYIGTICHLHDGLPFCLRVFIISFFGGIVFFLILMYKRRYLLRILLSYRRWLYEPPSRQTVCTTVWGMVVRFVSGYHPTMYSYQKSLPLLPVPTLAHTLSGFLDSVKPLYLDDSAGFDELCAEAKDFEVTVGPKLQRLLVLKSWWAENWVTDWWEKYVYLMSRSPLAINSNYYVLDHCHWKPTHRQVSRAASTIYQYLETKRRVDREQLEPLLIRDTIPLCMAQYERTFACTRIPCDDIDELVKYSSSKHIVVVRKGIYYKLDVFDRKGNALTPQSWEHQIQWVIDDTEIHLDEHSAASRCLAALTARERSEWARTRRQHFSDGVNRDSLDAVESSIFHVLLLTEALDSWQERGKRLLHGDGGDIWFDKSFNLVFFADGRYGMNTEHSWGDAPVIAHISEFTLTAEAVTGIHDSEGYCLHTSAGSQAALKEPTRLIWDVDSELKLKIETALVSNRQSNDDLDLCVQEFLEYGKGFIKTCKVSPDAYVQLALQLAYHRDAGRFVLTYEASMTRLYLLGRTETVRSLSCQTVDFVRAMGDASLPNSRKVELLQAACRHHQQLYRAAMTGGGIDRHLFGLYVISNSTGYKSAFLKNALMMPWTLSTSQQPQQQIATSPDCNLPQYRDKVSPGGGFGPVSDQGYGVSYMIPGNERIFFHVSSKWSAAGTDSTRFMQHLFESLSDMRNLYSTSSSELAGAAPLQNGHSTPL